MANPLARFDISGDQIDLVMAGFYARVRGHPELGPVFIHHIGDTDAAWEAHIAKITRFWRNAILREPIYDGNPMQVHMQARDVRVSHFEPWLALFEEVLHHELPQEIALGWLALAERIARGFKIQLASRDNAGVPELRS
ncbi:MAG: group III truncated hemoglobin [Pelagimonas sp.]|jgi:hemoglobin|nr:group III truncated hemoglobin [Pelagimonas sp.]